MSNRKLHMIDNLKRIGRRWLDEGDKCFYFMEKLSEGFEASEANQLIFNFKKSVDKKGRSEWSYKEKAIQKFAKDLCNHLKHPARYTLIPAPTSKPRCHPEWDDRIDQVVDIVAECKKGTVIVEKVIDVQSEHIPAHLGGTRDVAEIYRNTIWNGFQEEPTETVILIDDVLTTGAHFKAWKKFILNNDPRVKDVIGIFWAIHVWNNPFSTIEDLSF